MMITIAIIFHIIAAVIWVGGMFFAHFILRPSALSLPIELRLTLWEQIFAKFFPLVRGLSLIIIITGYSLIFLIFGSLSGIKFYIHIMMGIGSLMTLIFFYLWFFPYQSFKSALAANNFALAGRHQLQIRYLIMINLLLGLITTATAVTRYW